METINETLIPKIQEFAKSSPLAKDVFNALAIRERAAARSDIDAIFRELEAKNKAEINYFKYLDVWKMLEDAKVGTLVYGRKGNPNRFVWNTNFKHLGRIALGLPKEASPNVKRKSVKSMAPEQIKITEPAKVPNDNSRSVTFVIPENVPMDEIMALFALGAQLSENNTKVPKK